MTSTRTRARRNGEGTARELRAKPGTWQGRYYDKDGTRRSVYGLSEKAVLDRLAELRTARAQGLPHPERHWTLRSWTTEWLDTIAPASGVRPQSLTRYRANVGHWQREPIAGKKLVELETRHIRAAMVRFAATGMAPNTARNLLTFLRGLLDAAIDEGHLGRNVARKADLPPEPPRREPPSGDDLARLEAAIAGDPLEALWLLGLRVGLRLGEALGLRWADIELADDDGYLWVRQTTIAGSRRTGPPKSKAGLRQCYFDEEVAAALRAYRKAGPLPLHPSAYVFAPLDHRRVGERWRALEEAAGISRHYHFHDLRHAAATDLLMRWQPQQVQQYLGHADYGTTVDLYGHINSTAIRFPRKEERA